MFSPATATDVSRLTMRLSLQAQTIMMVMGLYALAVGHGADRLLYDVLTLEVVVQLVELAFYLFFVKRALTPIGTLQLRYADWVVTTPLMLVSMYALFHRRDEPDASLAAVVGRDPGTVGRMLAFNAAMLAAGYLYTTGRLGRTASQIVGFAALVAAFGELGSVVQPADRALFGVTLFVWALYGVAARQPVVPRNTWYNLLDIVSKNVVGVYCALLVLRA